VSDVEKAFTELFHRLPLEATPLGFRDAVMTRVRRERSRAWRWQWIVAAAVAVPNLLFLAWEFLDRGDELALAFAGVTNALLGVEQWDAGASVYVDGLLLVAVALVGLAAMLATHALLRVDQARPRRLAA
jgi:hypothetical protein